VIAYTLLSEVAYCAEPEPCDYPHQCSPTHLKRMEWEFVSTLSARLGSVHNKLANLTALYGRYVAARPSGLGPTGDVRIMVVNSDGVTPLKPLWSEAELAAYRMGGLEAVKRLQKGLMAEQRAAARALARDLKTQAKAAAKQAREARKHRASCPTSAPTS
jgi:hypothetical protein